MRQEEDGGASSKTGSPGVLRAAVPRPCYNCLHCRGGRRAALAAPLPASLLEQDQTLTGSVSRGKPLAQAGFPPLTSGHWPRHPTQGITGEGRRSRELAAAPGSLPQHK